VEVRRLGNSGLKVSAIGLGGNTFGATVDGDEAVDTIRAALDLGITFIDTADMYSRGRSEELIGQAVAGRRQDVIVASKVRQSMGESPYMSGLSRRWIMQAVEDSLRRLSTDYIDLYQAHAPDNDTPLEETLRAMHDLVQQGKVCYIGCSNYTAWEMTHALGISQSLRLTPWISVQPRWNLLEGLSDPTLLPACRALDVGIIPYRPIAGGVLTGKYRAGAEPPADSRARRYQSTRQLLTQDVLDRVERLRGWAEQRGHTVAELSIAWLLAHDEVSTVIVGARTMQQVEENARPAAWRLTVEERDEVAGLVAEPSSGVHG
jgi:aryl-alcohol dehydrogenase-like predicted oxidoreductase